MNGQEPHILIRPRNPVPPKRSGSKLVYAGRTTDILVAGIDSSFTAEDDYGICMIVSDRNLTLRASELLDMSRQDRLDTVASPEGHFAAVILDKRSETVTVLRDPAGFQHVFYGSGAFSTVISTDLGWLVSEGGLGPGAVAVDQEALALYVSFQYIPAPYTIYRGIRQLRPGEMVRSEPGRGLTVRQHAPLIPAIPDYMTDGIDNSPRQVRRLLRQSLTSALGDDGNLGAFLSGGMDTSANVAILADCLGIKPLAITATFREPQYDESKHARIVADHYGLDHIEVAILPEMLCALPAIARHFSSPHGDRAIFAQHFLAMAAREAGCERVCTGEGGDEVMGYPRSRDKDETYRSLPARSSEFVSWYFEKTCLAPAPWRQRLLRNLQIEPEIAVDYLAAVQARYSGYSRFEQLYFGQWETWLIDGVYMKDREILGAHGLRPVLPFMNTALMQYMSRLDPETKMSELRDKNLVKRALRASLPVQITEKTKHKFWLPFAEWFRGPSRQYLEDVLASRQGFVRGQFGSEAVRDLITEHMAGVDHSRLLWALLFLELWHTECVQIR
jgi:asparagine synthase (glutamine-hydrolysing)